MHSRLLMELVVKWEEQEQKGVRGNGAGNIYKKRMQLLQDGGC